MSKQPNRKRRWLRLIVFLTIMFSLWLTWYVYRVERQQAAVRFVKENGGSAYYNFESEDHVLEDGQPAGPKWLHDVLGIDYFAHITRVELCETKVTELTRLKPFKRLEKLDLDGTQVSDLSPLIGKTNSA